VCKGTTKRYSTVCIYLSLLIPILTTTTIVAYTDPHSTDPPFPTVTTPARPRFRPGTRVILHFRPKPHPSSNHPPHKSPFTQLPTHVLCSRNRNGMKRRVKLWETEKTFYWHRKKKTKYICCIRYRVYYIHIYICVCIQKCVDLILLFNFIALWIVCFYSILSSFIKSQI